MPGTTRPAAGIQAFVGQFQALSMRIANIETWQRNVTPTFGVRAPGEADELARQVSELHARVAALEASQPPPELKEGDRGL